MKHFHTVFLTHDLPYPTSGGAKIRNSNLIHLLKEKSSVEILCFGQTPSQAHSTLDISITLIPKKRSPFLRRLFSPLRPYFMNGWSVEMAEALRERAPKNKETVVLLWIDRMLMAQYIPLARTLGYKTILDDHNVESDVLIQGALMSWRNWHKLPLALQALYEEVRLCKLADIVVATSAVDVLKLQKLAPQAEIKMIPNLIDCDVYSETRSHAGKTLFFVGTLDYFPNDEGLRWFVKEVLPEIKGDNRPPIVVAGSNPSQELKKLLEENGIKVIANPESVLPYLKNSAAVFVPILSGSGTRLKILEAMAAGRAIVSTHKGAEGLDVKDRVDIFLADTGEDFARKIEELFKTTALREKMGTQAFETVKKLYDWRASREKMDDVLGDSC